MNNATPTWGPILIVDDDASMRALVAAILEEAGYATICVECGEAALLAASESSLSAAVLDVNLVGLSGYEVCHELRRRHGAGLPIIFISGDRTEPFDRAAGMLLGADDYLVKPFAPAELLGCVNSAIERAKPETRRGVLTVREHEILELLASGLAQGAIATRLELNRAAIDADLKRRQEGYGRSPRQQIEQDRVDVLAGLRHGRTLGTPLALVVQNVDHKNWTWGMSPWPPEGDPAGKGTAAVTLPRPGHADLAGVQKHGLADVRDALERASARHTAVHVAAGSVAKALLAAIGISVR